MSLDLPCRGTDLACSDCLSWGARDVQRAKDHLKSSAQGTTPSTIWRQKYSNASRAGQRLISSAGGNATQEAKVSVLGKLACSMSHPENTSLPHGGLSHHTHTQVLVKRRQTLGKCERIWMNHCIFLTSSGRNNSIGIP